MSERFNRRKFLAIGAVMGAGGAALASGCGLESDDGLASRQVILPKASYPTKESIFRAASIRLGDEHTYGTGSFLKVDSDYYLYSIGHVAEEIKKLPVVYAETKGVARFKINPSRFVMVNRFLFAQKEPLAFYPLEGMELKMLLEEVKNGRLAPLTFALNKPGAYEEMLSPRIERDAIEKLRILSYIPEWNAYTVVATAEYSVCGGMSGSPVIRAQGSVVTNEIYGVISASFTSTRDEKESSRSNNTCAFAGLFIPNLYPNRFLPQF